VTVAVDVRVMVAVEEVTDVLVVTVAVVTVVDVGAICVTVLGEAVEVTVVYDVMVMTTVLLIVAA
jgi:hypothetical protein